MGALTDSRKRLSADHRLVPSFFPSSPPPKKARLPSLPSASSPPPSSVQPSTAPATAGAAAAATTTTSSSSYRRRRLPPGPPRPRHIHGPQRIVRAFRDASRPASQPSPSFPPAPASPPLGLEQYVELVNSVAQPPPPRADADVARKAAEAPIEVVGEEGEGGGEEEVTATVLVRKAPLYRELLEDSSRRHDARLRSLEFEKRLEEKRLLGLKSLREVLPQVVPKEEVPEPFIPLADEDEDDVRQALGGRNRCEVLARHESSNIMITTEILQCLNLKEWLNDEVINLYLELLKEREQRDPKKFLKCHFFNTFFYKKLISGGYGYKAVRRWTTKRKLGYSLIECDKIFVPIHKEVHWCLAVINIRDKKFQYLDSLGSMDTKVLKVLARYLADEAKDKCGQQIDALSWKQEGVERLPLQENGWDCGMFMLKYIDFYSRDMDLSFGQKHMPYFRRRTAKEILKLRAE